MAKSPTGRPARGPASVKVAIVEREPLVKNIRQAALGTLPMKNGWGSAPERWEM
jgi:hypothetical protein